MWKNLNIVKKQLYFSLPHTTAVLPIVQGSARAPYLITPEHSFAVLSTQVR